MAGPETDAALIAVQGLESRDADGQVSIRVVGEHFCVGGYPKGERPQDSFVDFVGRRLSIMPYTLQRLEGKCLVLTKPDWSRRRWFVRKSVIRAEPASCT